MAISRADSDGMFVIDEKVRIVEIGGGDFLALAGHRPGLYNPEYGKILLNRDRWCLKNLYHEVLHSLSIFSCRVDLKKRADTLAEGLTEFFTGVLLWKSHPYCYENCWRRMTGKECQYTYGPFTNYWCAFGQKIHVRQILDLYFWKGNASWEALFGEFIGRIRSSGYPEFTNILLTTSPFPLAILFHDECVTRFGQEYEDASERDPDIDKVLL
jgi:hypothetical protein